MKRFAYLAAWILIPVAAAQDAPAPELPRADVLPAVPDAAAGTDFSQQNTTPDQSELHGAALPTGDTSPRTGDEGKGKTFGGKQARVPSFPSESPAVNHPDGEKRTEENPVAEAPAVSGSFSAQPGSSPAASPLPAESAPEKDAAAALPLEILMADKELALSDPDTLMQAITLNGILNEELPRHVAVVQRFNEDMQLLLTLLKWADSKEEADKVAASAGILCRRGVDLVTCFEEDIAPQLTEAEQTELSNSITPEQKQALTEVFRMLMGMVQSGFFGSEALAQATAPLLKSMLGVPSP